MRSRPVVRANNNQCRIVATVLGSIPASLDTVESEGRQMNHETLLNIVHKKRKVQKNLPFTFQSVIMLKLIYCFPFPSCVSLEIQT
jgi:hypothetical protein